MQRRILTLVSISLLLLSIINWGCSKLDTTDIGSDLLPPVDNVKTFDTLLTINTTQGISNDTQIVNRSNDQALGAINNDPLFGKTNAHIFMQLKPRFYPFYLGNIKDTLTGYGAGLDSVVLCLKYKGFWGDSTLPVHLEVRQINDKMFNDSAYKSNFVNLQPGVTGPVLGSKDVDVRTMGTYIKYNNGRDSVNNQIRIKITNTAFANLLYGRDSIATNFSNNAFFSDSIYRNFYNGLAVIANGAGNGLIYVNIADTSTKLEIHFKRRNNGKVDSIYNSLVLNADFFGSPTKAPSATVNNIVRARSGPVLSPAPSDLYLQTAPGTYVNLNIPALSTLSNRIIHRAEIIIEQVPTDIVLDGKLTAPNFLYLDLKDTGTANNFKPIYFDLSPNTYYEPDYKNPGIPYFPTGGIDYQYFGGYRREKIDNTGNQIKYYNFNISRYVQQIVTKHTPNYNLRLYAPFNLLYSQHSTTYIPFSNNIAFGRVRLGSGTNSTYKMRLRIVYSKL